jgi:hypothetical protein
MTPPRSLLPLLVAVRLTGLAQANAQTPSFIAKGACPFECCSYGTWSVKAETDVRSGPDTSAPIIARLSTGTQVRVLTGEVHVLPGLARVTGRPHSSAAGLDPKQPIEILDYRGEGYSRVRQGQRLSEVKIARTKRECAASPNWRYCWVDVIREPISTWWVQVQLPDSRLGWVLMEGRPLQATDACG